jgi:hypothetical protein
MIDVFLATVEAALRGFARTPFFVISAWLVSCAERVRSYRLWRA